MCARMVACVNTRSLQALSRAGLNHILSRHVPQRTAIPATCRPRCRCACWAAAYPPAGAPCSTPPRSSRAAAWRCSVGDFCVCVVKLHLWPPRRQFLTVMSEWNIGLTWPSQRAYFALRYTAQRTRGCDGTALLYPGLGGGACQAGRPPRRRTRDASLATYRLVTYRTHCTCTAPAGHNHYTKTKLRSHWHGLD